MAPGERIRRIRKDRGITQRELAELLGITPSYVSHIESGQRAATAEMLYRIARFLNVRLSALVDEPGPPAAFQSARALPDAALPDLQRCARFHANLWELENLVGGRPIASPVAFLGDLPTSPKKAAADVREALGHTSRRSAGLDDLVRALAMQRVTVFSMPLSRTVAGLATREAPSAIFINAGLAPRRRLFTLAQALGHLVLHPSGVVVADRPSRRVPEEEDADAFAVEFLMPSDLVQELAWMLPDVLDRVSSIRWMADFLGLDPIAVLCRVDQLGRLPRARFLECRRALEAAARPAAPDVPVVWDPPAHLPDRYLVLARLALERHDLSAARFAELLDVEPAAAQALHARLAERDDPGRDPAYYASCWGQ